MSASISLTDNTLFRQQCYIDGNWVDADDGTGFPVTNPADGATLGRVPNMGSAEVRRAIQAADAAWPVWRDKTAKERAVILKCWSELMMAHQEDLAVICTSEMGKTSLNQEPKSRMRLHFWNGSQKKADEPMAMLFRLIERTIGLS